MNSIDGMDFDAMFDMPGGDDFREVTALFNEAAQDMDPGATILTEGFSLQDAMSVLEIGEPRLDSGITLQEERRPPFDPLFQMLPEEVCWIMDRSFACETEWHAGNSLSQTVFTLLYTHHLMDFNPEFIPISAMHQDASRPPELITVVLRSAVIGLLKCCDLGWRELSQDNVHDGEDWQGEKCEVSLLEGVPVKTILSKVEEACSWIRTSSKVTKPWRDALMSRIFLRKTILELMNCDSRNENERYRDLIVTAREHLRSVHYQPCPDPAPGSQAYLVFDPFVARRLNTFGPLRNHILPPQETVWEALEGFLDDCDELRLLRETKSITTWEIVGNLRAWSSQQRVKFPYLRSSTQSAFFNGVLVLNRFSLAWIVDRFFFETLDLSYAVFSRRVREGWRNNDEPPLPELERLIRKLVIGHVKALYQNPPRRRRLFMKSLLDWHALYDLLADIVTSIKVNEDDQSSTFQWVPNAALLWRLSIIREVIFSGIQLQLYTIEEKAFAYWYAAQVMREHASCLRSLILVVSKESTTFREMEFQYEFLTALQSMSTAMFAVTSKTISFSLQRLRLNFLRRYKWAFRPAYIEYDLEVVAPPDFFKFISAREHMLANIEFSPSNCFKHAQNQLQRLATLHMGWAGYWTEDRIHIVKDLVSACENLRALPATMGDLPTFDISSLIWDSQIHPWFPSLARGTEPGINYAT